MKKKEYISAIKLYQTAILHLSNNPLVLFGLANSLRHVGEQDLAINYYKKAIEVDPTNPKFYNNLGILMHEKGNADEAFSLYKISSSIDPNYADLVSNLGLSYQIRENIDLAEEHYNLAIKINPSHADALINLSSIKFQKQQYSEAWNLYENRLRQDKGCLHSTPNCSQWNGKQLPESTPLLIVSEQGLGDSLMFMRYVQILRQKHSLIQFSAQTKLHGLIQISGIESNPLSPDQGSMVRNGVWTPLLSLPRILNVSPTNVITNSPYLKTCESETAKWKKLLRDESHPVIGINWQGNP